MHDVCNLVLNLIQKNSSKVFLIDAASGQSLTYKELDEKALYLMEKMKSAGVSKGDRVGLLLPNGIELACLYFACLYLGAVAVPVNISFSPEEVNFILLNSGLALLIHDDQTAELSSDSFSFDQACMIKGRESTEDRIWSLIGTKRSPGALCPFVDAGPDDLFSLTFTSGTTSRPKGIFHRVQSLFHGAQAFNSLLGIESDHRFYHVLPMTYMAGFLNNLLSPFVAGASVVINRVFDARMAFSFWSEPAHYGVNIMWLPPSILTMLLQVDRTPEGTEYARKNMDFICVGTAPLSVKQKKDFQKKYGVELFESYGLSETLFLSSNFRGSDIGGSVGSPLDGVRLRIVDDKGKKLDAGKEGEVEARTPFLMAALLDYETSEPVSLVADSWFPTGDIGRIGVSGELYITDRKKDLIIRGGENVSPREIEDVLEEHPGIEESAVVGVPHEIYGEEVCAAVCLKEGVNFDAVHEELLLRCKEKLKQGAWPSRLIQIDNFPRSSTGKIKKVDLKSFFD